MSGRGLRRERVLASPRFRDGAFRNTHPRSSAGMSLSLMGEFFFGGERRMPSAPLPSHDPLPHWQRAAETGLRVTWLGHSTMLLELDGRRVLTDPVWGRASPFSWVGPRRFAPVPVSISALPELDAVVISHDHYDHLDRGSVMELARREVPFVTSLGVGEHLEGWGVPADRIHELDWWEQVELCGGDLVITAAPAQHFSGRMAGGRDRTLWSSVVLQTANRRVFFSGDTGLTPEYEEIRTRFAPFDLVMLEVGAYHPAWGGIHLGPENALAALELLGGARFLPVHWGTFNLAMHAWDEPAETLLSLAEPRGIDLLMPELGAVVEPSRVAGVVPWWRGVASSKTDRSR